MRVAIQNVEKTHTPGKGGGWYKGLVYYINEDGQERKQPLVSFKNPAVWKAIDAAKQGDSFDVTVTKNGQYDEWAAIAPAVGGVPQASTGQASSTPPSGGTGKVLGSQYESREERIARQRLIVRQSSLSNAIEMLTTGAKSPPETAQVLLLAEELCNWVYEPTEEFTKPEGAVAL